MMGAIIGDIVGSVYEWRRIKTKDFPLFREDCFFTDDTVMTCAVAGSINRSLILPYPSKQPLFCLPEANIRRKKRHDLTSDSTER